MKYLDASAVEARGQHFNIPLTEIQPSVPSGQRLVAILTCGRTSIALDVSDPRDYRNAFCTHGNMFAIRLFWLDEDQVPRCHIANGN